MSSTTLNLTPRVYEYLLNHSLREPEILKKCRVETQQGPHPSMQISPEQGQFMGLLIELLGAKKSLDIGTFTGYSALAVALAMPEDGKVIACDVSEEWIQKARQYWKQAGVLHKIDTHIAPAVETLHQLIKHGHSNTFDFAFIDADKTNYETYYELSLQLLRRGGLIAIDNVLWSGSVADLSLNDPDTVAIRAINDKIAKDERVTLSMLPVGDGLTLTRKR